MKKAPFVLCTIMFFSGLFFVQLISKPVVQAAEELLDAKSLRTIVLDSGEKRQGKLVEQTDRYIRLNISGIYATFYLDQVRSIDGEPVQAAGTKGPKKGAGHARSYHPEEHTGDVSVAGKKTTQGLDPRLEGLIKKKSYQGIEDFAGIDVMDCGSIDHDEMVFLMFGQNDHKDMICEKMSQASKNSLTCINQAVLECRPSKFKVNSTDVNPVFGGDSFSPAMGLVVHGKGQDSLCRINNCVIPMESIINRESVDGMIFLFTMIGFSPQAEGKKTASNDLYDPVTEQVIKSVCPANESLFIPIE